jgi:hypothetical protein
LQQLRRGQARLHLWGPRPNLPTTLTDLERSHTQSDVSHRYTRAAFSLLILMTTTTCGCGHSSRCARSLFSSLSLVPWPGDVQTRVEFASLERRSVMATRSTTCTMRYRGDVREGQDQTSGQAVVRRTDQTYALATSTSRLPAGQALRPCLPPPWSPQPLAGQALRPCSPASWPPRRGQAASPLGGRMCSERLRGQKYGARPAMVDYRDRKRGG